MLSSFHYEFMQLNLNELANPNKITLFRFNLVLLESMGAERRVLGARATTKFSEENLQWAGTHKVLAEKVRGNGNFR